MPSRLDAPESDRYVEDDDAVTCQFEASLLEHKWIVQVTQLDRRMLSTQQLLAELHTGTLVSAGTLVWRGGMEDWLPVRDVEALPIAGLALERARLERRSRGQRHVEARDSLRASRLLATLPPADIVRRLRGAVALHPARLPATRVGALLASSLLACATIFMTLYVLSKGGVFDAGDNEAPRAGTIRRAQAALRGAGQAQQGPEHDLGREPTKPASVGAQAGN